MLRTGLYALLLVSPLPFASVQPWAVMTIALVAACLGAGALWIACRTPAAVGRRARHALVAAGIVIFVGSIQLVPAPPAWRAFFAEPASRARDAVARTVPETATRWPPTSFSAPDTTDALVRLGAYALVGLTAAVSFRDRKDFRVAAAVVATAGTFQGLYGAYEYLSGHQHIFAYAKIHHLESASGTFINRNHYAGYLAMTLPFALALVFRRRESDIPSRSWRQRVVELLSSSNAGVLAAGGAAVAIWAGVLLSYSRGGLAAALAATAFFSLRSGLGRGRSRLKALALALLVPVVVLLMWQDAKVPGERFLSREGELRLEDSRLPVWTAAMRMIPAYLWLGSGFGTFEDAFVAYKPETVRLRWDHAHNDWLQVLIEGGIVSLAACVAILLIALPARKRHYHSRRSRLVACAAPAALAAIAVHSLMDFCLRIPAIALLAAFVVGTQLAVEASRRAHNRPWRRRADEPRTGRPHGGLTTGQNRSEPPSPARPFDLSRRPTNLWRPRAKSRGRRRTSLHSNAGVSSRV